MDCKTEYKHLSDEQLAVSEARYKSLFHNSFAVQLIIDSETGDIFDANFAASSYYGFSMDELRTMKLWEINPSGEEFMRSKIRETYLVGSHCVYTRHRRADGEVREVEVFSGRVKIDDRKMIYAIVHDVTDQRMAERELLESEKRFRQFVESAPDAIFVQTDHRFAYVNQKAVEVFGAADESQLLGQYIPDHFAEEFRDNVRSRIKILNETSFSVPLMEQAILRLDGGRVPVEVSAVPFRYDGKDGALVYLRDITQRRKLETDKLEMEMQLEQKHKLESIGTLAGGVAHEINNPITGIINYAQLILDEPGADQRIEEYCNEIMKEGNRIAEIVRNLLKFARQEKQSHSPAQIADIIEQTISLIGAVMRHDQISLESHISEHLPSIKCRSQQIQQVLMNLFTNARDALNEKYKGYHADKRIIVGCEQFHRADRRWIRVTVEDHGPGIPDAILDKVFDPFFTTKPREIGTGLGLSVSHGIVKDHHGELFFETEPGSCTKAIVELPVDNGWDVKK